MSEDTRRMLQPAAIGGVVFGVLSGIPLISVLNCACGALAQIGAGLLAAHLYFRNLPAVAQQSYGEGAILGLLTGGIGATVSIVVRRLVVVGTYGIFSPEATGESIGFFLLGFFMTLIAYSPFAMVGGIIGVAVFQKKMPAA